MTLKNSDNNLKQLVDFIKNPMKVNGFILNQLTNSISHGEPIAYATFLDNNIKIGLTFKGNSFNVSYETEYSNISHNMIINYLEKRND